MNRRQTTAEETRRHIVAAGRKLFAERGYAQARVEDIAALAGVATVTVYASVGGKVGILQALLESCGLFQVEIGFEARVDTAKDANTLLGDCARTTRRVREEFEDVIYAMQDAAPFDEVVAAMLNQATKRYRGVLTLVASRLLKLGNLRRGMSTRRVTDLLWFHFGWWSWFTLHNENGWTYDEAEAWLLQSAKHSILEQTAH